MNPSSSSLSSSSSSSKRKRNPNSFDEPNCKRPKNDVFMNYSFKDIGKGFISHLQGALRRNSFTIYDHTMLPIGQDVCSELLKAIDESEIYVLVFSIKYAFSIRCLDELVDIMDRRKFHQRKVLPVFFNIEPSHVKSQQGSFNEAFETHETNFNPERVQKWRQALNDAGQLSGHHLQNGDEEKFIRKIVKELGKMQNPQELQVTDHPVGIRSRVEKLISKLRQMGQEIVRQENEDEPGERTRLRDHRDVLRVLTECSGTKSVESIRLDDEEKEEQVIMQVESLRKMSNLRLIKLDDPSLSWTSSDDDMPSLSFKKLKYLEWFEFPFKCMNIDMGNVVVIRLHQSKLEILWEGFKCLKKLRILDVSDSLSLTKTGNFYGLENLEELYFIGCGYLEELHSSIGCLHKLAILDLSDCTRLKRFPWEMIGKLRSLRQLNLINCENLRLERDEVIDPFPSSLSGNGFPSLPDSLGQLGIELLNCGNTQSIPNLPPNVTSVQASYCTSLVNLPSNRSELKFLTELRLDNCSQLGSEDPECLMKVTGLRSLRILSMRHCNVSQVPSEIGNLVSLQELYLTVNAFSSLPDSFSNLSELVHLDIGACSQLRLLPLLPSNLRLMIAYECWSLDVMPFDSTQMTYIFHTKMCKASSFTRQLEILFPEKDVPHWCSYRNRGHVLSFVAPMNLDNKICGMILCATKLSDSRGWLGIVKMLNKTKKTSHLITMTFLTGSIIFYPLDDTTLVVEAGDIVVLQFLVHKDPTWVLRCGLRLIYEDDVVDSKLVIQNVIEPTLPIPSEMTTNIAELSDISSKSDDEVCSFSNEDESDDGVGSFSSEDEYY